MATPYPHRTAPILCSILMLACASGLGRFTTGWAQENTRRDETYLFYGDSLVERLMESGHLEAWMQLARPDQSLRIRSLAWTGDDVGFRLRPEGYAEHLKNLLALWPAHTVVVGAGAAESFGALAGLPDFKAQLGLYLQELQRRHPGARLVLLSPIAVEDPVSGGPPNTVSRNQDLALYSQAMAEFALARGFGFIDLFAASQRAYASHAEPLTHRGIHPNTAGARVFGRAVAAALVGENALATVAEARVLEVAQAAAVKAQWVAEVVRPKNAVVYFGVRKRPEEYAEEMPRFHQLIDAAERRVHELVRSPGRRFADDPPLSLPPMATGRTRDAGQGRGTILPPAEAQEEFTVDPEFAVNLFASEARFPDLRNPVQIDFDSRGRLWVVTMPSFPHTVPGTPREDKILIFEDTDRDGQADRQTVFAEGLDALDGIAFHELGVLVSEQPRIWLMRDTNGDDRADERTELIRGIDLTDTHHGGMIATDPVGHVWFADGVFHRSQFETPFGVHRGIDASTYRLNPRTGAVETEWQSITPNPWKMTFDRWGNAFQMYGDGLVLDGLALTWTPRGVYHPFAYAQTVGYGKGSAAASISSPNFPEAYQQGMASAALLGSHTVSITRYDFTNGLVRGFARRDLVSSKNPAFRPADLAFGWDGALYVSDYCSAIIGHAQHPMRDPQWDHAHGRIWRVTHRAKPLVAHWPKIDGAEPAALATLLLHPQDVVRHHARIQLRRLGAAGLAAVAAGLSGRPASDPDRPQALLEALHVSMGLGHVQLDWLSELLRSTSPLHRAAGVRLLRVQAEQIPDAAERLAPLAADPHPRVQMEVIDAVAHLRGRFPHFEHVLHAFTPRGSGVQRMLADLSFGTTPAKGRTVEVLELAPEARLSYWQYLGTNGNSAPLLVTSTGAAPGPGVYRSWVNAAEAQSATLAVKHSFLAVRINGVTRLTHDSQWSSEQQVQFDLEPGLNLLELHFRRLGGGVPAIHVFDPLGQPLQRASLPTNEVSFHALASAWERRHSQRAGPDRIVIEAVPNQMQFSPKTFTVRAGQNVVVEFRNPDLMIHNLVVVDLGGADEVGLLADQLATQPQGMAKGYVPDSPKVLHATPLVSPKGTAILRFQAPNKPGRYPFLCTFPGHWRLMRGTMLVE